MAKKVFGWLAVAVFAASAVVVSACGQGAQSSSPGGNDSTSGGNEEVVLTGFDVPAEEEVSYGSIYTIPEYVVRDQNGTLYQVDYTVTNDGDSVSVVGGQISIELTTDYTITYTVTISQDDMEQKQTVLKVVDEDNPRVTLGGMRKSYTAGELIPLPQVEATDNLDGELTASLSLMKGTETVIENVTEAFTVEERGAYALVATATDKSGNVGTATAEFVVRNAPYAGEIEDFSDEYAAYSVSPQANYGESLVGEWTEVAGETALKISSVDTTGMNTKYPGLSLTPRISAEEIEKLKTAGFTAITMNIYLEDTQSRSIYHQWAYNTDADGNPTTHKQTNLGSVRNNVWTSLTLDLDLFLGAYDDIASGSILLFYFGNDPDYTTQTEFSYYIKDIYVTRELSDVVMTEELSDTYEAGAAVDLSEVTVSSATAADAGFDLVVTDPLGKEVSAENGTVTASEYGVYTVSAVPDQASKRYLGGASATFAVIPTAEMIEERVEEIMNASDMTSEAIAESAALLRNWLPLLGQVQGADAVDMFRYYAAMNLTNDAALKAEDNKLMYFDTALGKDQIVTSYVVGSDSEKEVETRDYIVVDPTVTYNGAPVTKIGFDDVNGGAETWCCPFYVRFSLPVNADLSGYSHIRFALRGYSYQAARPLEYALLYDGKRFVEPTVLQTGEWTEILIDLNANGITDLSKLKIAFYTLNNGNQWGSVWNNSDRFCAYISSVYGIVLADDIAISSDFVCEETYDLGDTLDLSGFVASSAAYPEITYVYTMEHNGTSSEIPASITFDSPGWYTLTATPAEDAYIGSASVRFYVNGSDEKPTVEYIEDTIETILSAPDKGAAEIIAKADLLVKWQGSLETVYGYETLDMFRYYIAMNLMTPEDGKLMYFDSALGKQQITIEYDGSRIPVATKDGISLDEETLYDGKPTTKIEFFDVPVEWFGPYVVNFTFPAETDASDYAYLRFWLKGYTYNTARPVTYFLYYDGTRFTDPVALTDGWTEVTIDIAAQKITDLSKLEIAFNTLNNGDAYGSVWNQGGRFAVNITPVYAIVGVDDITIDQAFQYRESYFLGESIDLTKFKALSAQYPELAYTYTVTVDGQTSAMGDSLTFDKAGTYTLTATVSTENYVGSVSVTIVVLNEQLPTAAALIQTAEDILAAADKTTAEIKEKVETLVKWKDMLYLVEGSDKIDMFRYTAAINLVELEDGKLFYFDTAFGKEQISTAYNLNLALESKNGITVDSQTTYNGKATTKIEFTDVPSEWFGPYIVKFGLPATETGYTHVRFWLKGYTYNAARPVTYFLRYDGNRITDPVALTDGWTEVLVDLKAMKIEDLSKLELAFNTRNGSDSFGSLWNEAGRFYAHITAVYGVNAVTDLTLNAGFPAATVYKIGTAPDLSKFTVSSAQYPDLVYSYTVNGLPASEASFAETGSYELKAEVATSGYTGSLVRTVLVVDPSKAFVLAEAEATISEIVPRGYGSDKTANSYVADWQGRKAIKAQTDPETSSANANAYKWPGADIHTEYTAEDLQALKAMGYTKMIIPVYLADSTADSLDVHYGPNGAKFGTIVKDQWVELEVPIDTVINSYSSTLSSYFFYIDNGNPVNHYTYYISDITLVAEA